jgi:hypothetical protein
MLIGLPDHSPTCYIRVITLITFRNDKVSPAAYRQHRNWKACLLQWQHIQECTYTVTFAGLVYADSPKVSVCAHVGP